jgi:hypothetical protein
VRRAGGEATWRVITASRRGRGEERGGH